jgi:hypothetical protein
MSLSLTREEIFGRVVQLCQSFGRNLAYYRSGWFDRNKHLLDYKNLESGLFWRTANGNFIDMCTIDWCKLFGDRRGTYFWQQVVTNPANFKSKLLDHLGLNEVAFQNEIRIMREYREKWVAHLDSERAGVYPNLDIPKKSVWFYYDYVVNEELLGVHPLTKLDSGYQECEDEACTIYQLADAKSAIAPSLGYFAEGCFASWRWPIATGCNSRFRSARSGRTAFR